MDQLETHRREAILLATYLIGKEPGENCIKLYQKAMQALPFEITEKDKRILNFIQNHNWSLSFLDAALTWKNPSSAIRKKIYTMLAILESEPEYSHLFLPKNFSFFYPLYIFFVLVKSQLKAIAGSLIILFV